MSLLTYSHHGGILSWSEYAGNHDDDGDDDYDDNTDNKTNLIQLNNGSCKQVWLHPRKVVLKYFHRLEVYCSHFDFYIES